MGKVLRPIQPAVVRALAGLKRLDCPGDNPPNSKGKVSDLSPLRGMKLTRLNVGRNPVADLSGLRSYQPGDPLQRVAWKAVARGAGWHTKHFEGGGSNGPADLAWNGLPRALGADARIARLTAWVLAAERVARPFALHLPGQALRAGQGREHRRVALTALAMLPENVQ